MNAELRRVAPWVALTLLGASVIFFARGEPARPARPSWEHSVSELSPADQQRYGEVLSGVAKAEAERGHSAAKQWPEAPFEVPGLTWSKRVHGAYVNYLGVPSADSKAQRWLVLILEPSEVEAKQPPPPVDDEHHTLADGTALHVTLWSQPNEGALPEGVLGFPVSDGWVRRVAY